MKGELVMVMAEERGVLWVSEMIHKCIVPVFFSNYLFLGGDLVCEAKLKFGKNMKNLAPKQVTKTRV